MRPSRVSLSVLFWDEWTLSLSYERFWTAKGLYRNLFFNGWHPVIPWIAFLLVGMWLGRQNLQSPATRRRIGFAAAEIAIIAEVVSYFASSWYSENVGGGWFSPARQFGSLLESGSLPPTPLYIIAKGATAVFVITLCIWLMQFKSARLLAVPFIATGKMALTLYVAHVLIGIFPYEGEGAGGGRPQSDVLLQIIVFCAAAMVFATVWFKFFRRGPLEWFMRKISG